MPDVQRMDAVIYLVGAIENFAGMSNQEVKKIGFEVATLGMQRFDVNDSTQKYQLRSMPGRYSGLYMVCLMYAAFKITDPTADTGFDLAEGYALANEMGSSAEFVGMNSAEGLGSGSTGGFTLPPSPSPRPARLRAT